MASIFGNLARHLNALVNPGVFKAQQQYQQALQSAATRLQRAGAGAISTPIFERRAERAVQRAEVRYLANPTPARLEKLELARASLMESSANRTAAQREFAAAQQAPQAARLGLFGSLFKGAVGQAGAAVGARSFGQVGGNILGAGANLAAMSGGPIGMAASAALKLGEGLMTAVDKLRAFSEQLLESNFRFAEFSGAMKRVEVENEIRMMRLSRERGERRADSTRNLAEARSRLETAIAPWEDAWARMKNEIFAELLEGMTLLVEGVNNILESLGIEFSKNKHPEEAMNQFMKEIGAARWFEKFGRPARFGQVPQDNGRGFTDVGGGF